MSSKYTSAKSREGHRRREAGRRLRRRIELAVIERLANDPGALLEEDVQAILKARKNRRLRNA